MIFPPERVMNSVAAVGPEAQAGARRQADAELKHKDRAEAA